MAHALHPGIHAPATPGPWKVDTLGLSGRVWHVIHDTTLVAKAIGPVRTRGLNYFDRAIAEADRRNRLLRDNT